MSAASQMKEYNKGQIIIDKLIPAPNHLAESKLPSRDCNLLIAIFDPNAYGIPSIDNYDISMSNEGLKDNFRQIIVLLNRDGRANFGINTLFSGAISLFKELPAPMSSSMERVKEFVNRIRN
jgi:hypothetical protein